MKVRAILILVVLLAAAGVAGAIAMASRSHSAGSTVKITEREMRISASKNRVRAGKVTLIVRNEGQVAHELVVMRWNRDAKRMPLEGFKVREEGLAVGEVAELEPNHSGRVTLTLKRGRYVLICNVPGHYMLGMAAAFTVS